MTNPRTWNRREFNVTPCGYFTILKPVGRFSATRPPGGIGNVMGPSKGTPLEQAVPGHADNQGRAIPVQIMPIGTHDRQLMRVMSVVLTAAAITFALLLWIMNP